MNHDAQSTGTPRNPQEPKSQTAENALSVTGKSPKVLTVRSARDVNRGVRERVVEHFMACKSSRDTAEAFSLPVRVVDDILLYALYKRTMQLERGPAPLVRYA